MWMEMGGYQDWGEEGENMDGSVFLVGRRFVAFLGLRPGLPRAPNYALRHNNWKFLDDHHTLKGWRHHRDSHKRVKDKSRGKGKRKY